MTSNLTQRLIQLEDLIPETNAVATIRQDVETISKQNNLGFQEGYDDLYWDIAIYLKNYLL